MDISFLREMAGLYAIGRLAKLDMTKCEIGNSVLRFDGCQSLETVLLPQKLQELSKSLLDIVQVSNQLGYQILSFLWILIVSKVAHLCKI